MAKSKNPRGKDEYNLDLSQRRANSVMKHLITFGIPADRIEAKGYGEAQPVASNKTVRGRAKNRRVEFVIVDPPLPSATPPAGSATP